MEMSWALPTTGSGDSRTVADYVRIARERVGSRSSMWLERSVWSNINKLTGNRQSTPGGDKGTFTCKYRIGSYVVIGGFVMVPRICWEDYLTCRCR